MKKTVLIICSLLLIVVACTTAMPFKKTTSKKSGWNIYENQYVRFELPKRYNMEYILKGEASTMYYDKGEISEHKSDFPELWVWFSDGNASIMVHYSTKGARGPDPEYADEYKTVFSFKESEKGKYKKRYFVSADFHQGNRLGGVYVKDTTNGFNDLLISAPDFDHTMETIDTQRSKLTIDELDRIAATIRLKK